MSRPVNGQGHAGEVAHEQWTPVSCVCVCVCVCVVHFCECVPSGQEVAVLCAVVGLTVSLCPSHL